MKVQALEAPALVTAVQTFASRGFSFAERKPQQGAPTRPASLPSSPVRDPGARTVLVTGGNRGIGLEVDRGGRAVVSRLQAALLHTDRPRAQ